MAGVHHHLPLVCVALGLLGCRATPPRPPNVDSQLFVSGLHSCARNQSGGLDCWGSPAWTSTIAADWRTRLSGALASVHEPVTKIAEGVYAELGCALTSSGALWCWTIPGPHPSAPLLRGVDEFAVSPYLDQLCVVHGSGRLSCWNIYYKDQPTLLRRAPGNIVEVALAQGARSDWDHRYVRTSDGAVWHQRGPGRAWLRLQARGAVDIAAGLNGAWIVSEDGTVRGHGRLLDARTVEGLDAVSVATADECTCVLQRGGTVSCWNGATVPSLIEGVDDAVEIGVSWDYACARTSDDRLLCWGSNQDRTLGDAAGSAWIDAPTLIEGIPPAKSVHVSTTHSCALTMTDELWCWGLLDAFGAVAKFSVSESSAAEQRRLDYFAGSGGPMRADPEKLVDTGPSIETNCEAADTGQVYCWGRNDYLQANPASPSYSWSAIEVAPSRLEPVHDLR